MWIPGFGWVKDEGGGSTGIPVDGEGNINKQIGVMGGGSKVGNPGDQLTGHKVGIMGDEETPTEKMAPPQAELPEPTGEVIYNELQPTPTKDSTPPDYRPDQ